MATKIRLTRIGKKGHPAYRIGIFEEGKKRSGKYIDLVGIYNPLLTPPLIKLDREKIKLWLSRGALPSATVANLIKNLS